MLLYSIGLIVYSMIAVTWIPVVMLGVMLIGTFVFRAWILKNFGGISGDLMGALSEVMEVVLWMSVLFCI